MSNNHLSFFSRFIVSCCAVLCIAVIGINPAFAQFGIGSSGSATTTRTTFQVKGIDGAFVNASGGMVGRVGDSACPFADRNIAKIVAAFEAAKNSDPDSCPHAEHQGSKIYFSTCGAVYRELSLQSADVNNPDMNMNLLCCERPPGERRDDCRARAKAMSFQAKVDAGFLSKKIGVPPRDSGVWSAEELQKFNAQKREKEETEKQCFEDSFNRIGQYWAQKTGVACIRYVSRAVKSLVKEGTRGLRSAMLGQAASGNSSTMVTGTSPGATISTPSIWGIGVQVASIANFATDVVGVASEASDILNTLSEACGNVLPELRQLQEWRKTVLGVNLCQAAENLLERQLTQCIRVNFSATAALNLPQFSVLLQCPVNINMNVRLSPRGFDCYGRSSVGSPIVATSGRRSLLGGGGGLENLFNGECFTSPSTRPEAGGNGTAGPGNGGVSSGSVGGRVPGVDCGPLDPNPLKQVQLQGARVLTQNRTTNGWAIGGNETVNGLKVTRCDFYDAGRYIRSAFVYGEGSSCSSQEGGFLSSGYETNTACYGGYVPAAAPNIPDACLYEAGCLNANGKLDINRVGSASCPSADPVFDPNRVYNTFVSGGVSSAPTNQGNLCSDFAEADPDAWRDRVCCDPQKQDCRQRDANVPLCSCDEGDALNRVKVDAFGTPDTMGRCEQGGKATCCSPRLNGGKEVCAQMQMPICQSEVADQCIGSNDPVSFTGPDGVTTTSQYTAAQVAQSKPSPYLYLFVRPDVTMPTGQQCCTTEWCNVCPQHYANAYGLSLKRDNTYLLPQSDADNRNIIGKGWPFVIKASEEPQSENDVLDLDSMINTEYLIGVQEVNKIWVNMWWFGDRETEVAASALPLHISDGMKMPVNLTACNNLSYLKTKPLAADAFRGDSGSSAGMGFAFNYYAKLKKRKAQWTIHGAIPEPMEYPIDYLNRLRRGVTDAEGTPLPPITLCNDVKICTPQQSGTVLQQGSSGGFSVGATQAPVAGGVVNNISPVHINPSLGTLTLQPATPATPTTPTLTQGVGNTGTLSPVTGGTKMVNPNVIGTVPALGTPVQPVAPVGSTKHVAPAQPGPSQVPSLSPSQPQQNSGGASGKYGLY